MALPTTSGTVSQYSFNMLKVIEHSMRRAGRMPERSSPEELAIARDLLFSQTSEWINAGFPLWTRQFLLLGANIGSPDVPCPPGTVDIFHTYWRILQPYRGPAIIQNNVLMTDASGIPMTDDFGNYMTSDAGAVSADGSVLVGGAPNADVILSGPFPGVQAPFGLPTEVDTIGVLLGGFAPVTAALQVWTSQSSSLGPWRLAQTLPTATYQPRTWTYFDLNPAVIAPYVQLVLPVNTAPVIVPPTPGSPILDGHGNPILDGFGNPIFDGTGTPGSISYPGTWALNQVNFGLANGTDIEIGPLNIDDYYNLPNKFFQADRADSAYVDRQLNAPVIKVWPTLNNGGFYNGTVTALVRRYIQDPGLLTNAIEVPQRWLEALMWRLATTLVYELPDQDQNSSQGNYFTLMAKQQRIQAIEARASKAEALCWAEERTQAPLRLAPNISCYTR